jgi:predicted phosphoribosyltransferase/alpha/beta superfamily hydrolase
MALFRNRDHAAMELAAALAAKGYQRPVVLGIPRGGVPIADRIARELNGKLGVVVARKLRAPMQSELAIGAVAANGAVYVNEELAHDTGADRRYLDQEIARQMKEAREREARFDGARRPAVAGQTVIVVDDGIATGATAIAALRSLKAADAARVVLAVPVGPPGTLEAMAAEADDVVCPNIESDFYAVGQFYDDFSAVSDSEVARLIEAFPANEADANRRAAVVERDGVRLATRLVLPAGRGPWPCVVFVHGLGSDKDSPRNVVIAERLVDEGFAAVLFDLSGHGESSEDPRGPEAFVDDVVAVTSWAAGQAEIDASRMALAGSSLGAVTALETARSGRLRLQTLVLRAPPLNEGDIAGLDLPALVLIGSHDPLLPQVRAICAPVPLVTLTVVPGAGHLFEEPGTLEDAVELSVSWLRDRLLKARPPVVAR